MSGGGLSVGLDALLGVAGVVCVPCIYMYFGGCTGIYVDVDTYINLLLHISS